MIVSVGKLLDLPRKVRPVVLDPMGKASDEVTIECYTNGVEIAHIFLQIVDNTTPNRRPRVRRNNRDRTRNREDMDDSARRTRHRDNRDEHDDESMGAEEVPDDSS